MKTVSYLYSLDLDNINKMITEMNQALSERKDDNQVSSSISPGEILWNEEVGTPTTQLVKEGISLKVDEVYSFNAHLFNGPTCTYSIYFNNDTTAGNYHRVEIYTANGAAVQAATGANSTIHTPTANSSMFINGIISFSAPNKKLNVQLTTFDDAQSILFVQNIHYHGVIIDDVYSMRIVSSAVDAIGKDSHIRMWRTY